MNKTVDIYEEDSSTGETRKTGSKLITTAKIVLPFPKKIVRTRNHFLFGGKMTVSSGMNPENLSLFRDVWEDSLKMQNVLKQLARTCMIETKAAVIFYPQPTTVDGKKVLKLRAKVLDNDSGSFFPHFDDYGDMDAFIWLFKVKDAAGKAIDKAKIYTADTIFTYAKTGGSWLPDNGDSASPAVDKHSFGKIPVVYVEQDEPEWESVVTQIDDFENRLSRLADTNDYFAEPLLKIFGDVKKAPGKDEVGKLLQFGMVDGPDGKPIHGDAEYATWNDSPQSIKLEMETAWDAIFSMTSTPDLSFNNIKGIGNVSGIAMQLMFMDAFVAMEEKLEIFDPALKRCLSVVTAGIGNYTDIKLKSDLETWHIDVSFDDKLPKDVRDMVETLSIASGNKPIMSQKTAASINPLVSDAENEISNLADEATGTPPNESFNP